MNINDGLGSAVPPDKADVIIYFNEKGESEDLAVSFFTYWANRNWLNRSLRLISNWKVAAWTWINYRPPV